MGKSLAKLWRRRRRSSWLRVLMLGLDAAGKTTILYKMKLGQSVTTIPTVGFNVETVPYSKTQFTIWDVAGQDKVRPLWRNYFQNTQVLIIVVDCADHARMDELKDEIKYLTDEDRLKGVPVLLLANKQDLPSALSPRQVEEKLKLPEVLMDRKWYVQPACATSGDGLYEGLTWIHDVTKPV